MVNNAIRVNLALLLKSCPGKAKCFSAGKEFGTLTSFLWYSNGYWRQSYFYQHSGHYITLHYIKFTFAIDIIEDFEYEYAFDVITFEGHNRCDLYTY